MNYRIEASYDLEQWATIETPVIGTGSVIRRLYFIDDEPKRFSDPAELSIVQHRLNRSCARDYLCNAPRCIGKLFRRWLYGSDVRRLVFLSSGHV